MNLWYMQDENIIAKDSGYASRKLWFALFTSIMILAASRICPAPTLGEVIYGLVAVAGVYITGNVITKWKASGIEQAKIQAKVKAKPAAKPKAEDLSD